MQRIVQIKIRYDVETALIHIDTDIHDSELDNFDIVTFDEYIKSKNLEYTASINEHNCFKVIL
jgi:hypothetical protein